MTNQTTNIDEVLQVVETEELDQTFVLVEESQFVPALLQDC